MIKNYEILHVGDVYLHSAFVNGVFITAFSEKTTPVQTVIVKMINEYQEKFKN